jgi:hypothetical protein
MPIPPAILLYELLIRQRAYEGQYIPVEDIAKRAADAKTQLRPPMPNVWPVEAKKLISLAWAAEPSARPDFRDLAVELGNWRYWQRTRARACENAAAMRASAHMQVCWCQPPRLPSSTLPRRTALALAHTLIHCAPPSPCTHPLCHRAGSTLRKPCSQRSQRAPSAA